MLFHKTGSKQLLQIVHFYILKLATMKSVKQILFFVLLLSFTSTQAQLSKIKKDRDESNEKLEAAQADNASGWALVSNPKEVLYKNIFTVTDQAVEDVTDVVQKADINNKLEKVYFNTDWKFYDDGEMNFSYYKTNFTEFAHSISGNNITIKKEGVVPFTVELYQKNNLYKLRIKEASINKYVNLVLTATAKKGWDLYSLKELRKYDLKFLGTNGDMYMLKQAACFSTLNSVYKFYYNYTTDGKFEWFKHYVNGETLEYAAIPVADIDMKGFEISWADNSSMVDIPVTKSYTLKTYNEKGLKETTTSAKLQYGSYNFSIVQALYLIKDIANKLPTAKKSIFNGRAPAREAEVAAIEIKEKAAWAKVQQERQAAEDAAPASSNTAPNNSSAGSAKTKISLELANKSKGSVDFVIVSKGGGSKTNTSLNSSSTKKFTVEVGGKILNAAGGVIVAIVTADMDGQKIVIAQ
jgi:hypothetical protein